MPIHRIALAPEAGAACLAGNAHAVAAGAVAHVQPLYGTERIAVIVRARPAGEALAVAYLERHKAGSEVRLTTTRQFAGDPDELERRLLAGC